MRKENNAELASIESDIKKLQARRSKLLTKVFEEEELPLLKAQVGKYFKFASGNEMVKLTDFDEDEGYRVEEFTLQKEGRKYIRFVHSIYWKGWYPFYDIKTASPLGHGYEEVTAKEYAAFVEKAVATASTI